LDAVYYGNNYEKALYEIMGKEKGDKKLAEMNLYGSFKKFPEELGMTLFLTDVKLEWNTNTSSYRYKGYFGVASANKVELNKMMYGMIELTKKRSGDKLSIYLEPGEDTWYYFEYSKGLLGAISSDPNFNNPIKDTKPEARQGKEKEGAQPYQYTISSEIKKRNFVKSFTGAGADE
jgi:viroplasmin and RNaseH domain-containing protein